ncbi:MAG: serine/threonine protein kinase, partial [Acidobacteria bacterium]|nr:serine/threonine protein kinase [Acidobacteriota bacterium]
MAVGGQRASHRTRICGAAEEEEDPMTDETRTVDLSLAMPPPPWGEGGAENEGGGRLGRYVLLYRLGSGGMGIVYAAYDPELDRKVAVKVLRTGEGGDDGRAAVVREARAMARLVHPNVVTVYDVGSEGSRVFLAMEFVAGRTLRDWVDEERPSWRQCLRVFELAGRGLAAAHAADIVHQDFKPSNVIIKRDGEVRVLDFGIARIGGPEALTTPGTMMGTPGFMAPEQLRG